MATRRMTGGNRKRGGASSGLEAYWSPVLAVALIIGAILMVILWQMAI